MKSSATKTKRSSRDWLLGECEKLRQEGNLRTDKERREARERALKIIYGTDATKPARRR